MKAITFLIFFLMCQLMVSQKDGVVQNSNRGYEDVNLIFLDLDGLRENIYNSKGKIKVVYFFDDYCSASEDVSPVLNEFYLKNQSILDLFVIYLRKVKKKEELYNYLFFEGYYFPFYSIGKVSYNRTIKKLCPQCDPKKMGYSDFFILNQQNELVLQTNYNLSSSEKLDILKKHVE